MDPETSWTGLSQTLKDARLADIKDKNAANPKVLSLFGYAMPDAVITVNGEPIVSIEQTRMNPSGHNIPQRFSFHVRAAELGVPSILYYPEFAKRTFSDPNVRYLQVRVPLAQKRLTDLFGIPALSVFWPTNRKTKQPDNRRPAHQGMANVVDEIISGHTHGANVLDLSEVKDTFAKMNQAILNSLSKSKRHIYRDNSSVRALLPRGFPTSVTSTGQAIDPPLKAKLLKTTNFIDSVLSKFKSKASSWSQIESKLRERTLTLFFTGTANKSKNDSEHPWPGYLTLLDILYLRIGRSHSDRMANLVYGLPVEVQTFVTRANQSSPPTATSIVDTFADLVMLDGGGVAGRPMRGSSPAVAVVQ